MSDPVVQDLPEERLTEAADVMAQAFLDSPSYLAILRGDESTRLEILAWLFHVNLSMLLKRDPHSVRCVLEDGRVVAAMCLLSPSARLREVDWLTSRLILLPLYYGWAIMRRLLDAMFWFEGTARRVFRPPGRAAVPSASIERLVVRPECQGRGIGTACLRAAVAMAESEHCVLRLATQEERNVRLYERVGFQTLECEDRVEDDEKYSYKSWFMEFVPQSMRSAE